MRLVTLKDRVLSLVVGRLTGDASELEGGRCECWAALLASRTLIFFWSFFNGFLMMDLLTIYYNRCSNDDESLVRRLQNASLLRKDNGEQLLQSFTGQILAVTNQFRLLFRVNELWLHWFTCYLDDYESNQSALL